MSKQLSSKMGGHSHSHGLPIAVQMLEMDKAVKKALESLHERHFGKNLDKILSNQFAYRKASFDYLKDAQAKGISVNDAINVHDNIAEPTIRKLHVSRTGGQKPSKVLHINSSMERSGSILSHGAFVDEKKSYVDASFVININVRDETHFPEDFQPSAYMSGHTVKHDKYAMQYEPFIAPFGSENKSRGKSEKEEMDLLALRRGLFISQSLEAGFQIETSNGVPYRVSHINGKMQKTYLPLILHDTLNCEYYVYEDGKKTLLEEWFKKAGIAAHPSVKKDIEALALHRKEKPYFDEYINMVSKRKKIECTDSRENDIRNETRNSIRIIGAILTSDERERLLKSRGVEYITDGAHFGCGYLTTAMKLHEAGAEIKAIFDKGERDGRKEEVASARSFLKRGMESVFNGTWKGFSLNDLTAELENLGGAPVSSGTLGLLNELLKSDKADIREIARHMNERGVLEWNDSLGTFAMPAALRVDEQLGEGSRLLWSNRGGEKKKADELQKQYFDVVTIQVAKDLEEAWHASLVETGSKVKVRVVIKNYDDGISYVVKDGELYDPYTKQRVEEV